MDDTKRERLAVIVATEQGKGRKYPDGAECDVEGCTSRPKAYWLCYKHLRRWQRHGNPTVVRRPWQDTEKSDFCKWGHDKRIVGRASSGACVECNRLHARLQRKRKPRQRAKIPNLRKIRREYGLTQQQFADLAGLHVNCIGDIERGRAKAANRETLRRVIAAVRTLQTQERQSDGFRAWTEFTHA